MGNSLEAWRGRIGRWSAGGMEPVCFISIRCKPSEMCVLTTCLFAIFSILLLIGNVESNPGPVFHCHAYKCNFQSNDGNAILKHQPLHQNDKNFIFKCPYCSKIITFPKFKNLMAHCESLHKPGGHKCKTPQCSFSCEAPQIMARHQLTVHFAALNPEVYCAFGGCHHAPDPFAKKNVYLSHLSQYHPTWRQNTSGGEHDVILSNVGFEDTGSSSMGTTDFQGSAGSSIMGSSEFQGSAKSQTDFDVHQVYGNDGNIDSSEVDPCSHSFMDDDLVVKAIAKFYLMLQADALVPATTVQQVAESLQFISELIQARSKVILQRSLKKENIEDGKISAIIHELQVSDPLYATHHEECPGPNLTSDYFRMKFYKNYFGFSEPDQINLSLDPTSKRKIQYVSIRQTLEELLSDPSVQRQVEDSFARKSSPPGMFKDYYDGDAYKMRVGSEEPTIDLNLFQDAFSLANPIGSAKKKYKFLGTYMTLGNLLPHVRSKLDAIRLLLIFKESLINVLQIEHNKNSKHKKKDRAHGVRKCFGPLLSDLKDLVENGIMFNGRKVNVRICHILGDNLGSHMIGGFRQYFTSGPVCRFCTMTLEEFRLKCGEKELSEVTKPFRTKQDYEGAYKKAEEMKKKKDIHYGGIKHNSIFNDIGDFHVADGLPPCLAHDFFEGVANVDFSLIIQQLVAKKWFSYEDLNKKIAGFTFLGIDSTNKPAPVNSEKAGIKIGGHAVQNWMLIRMLPLIIEGNIKDASDPVWQFYLTMKELCEYICAPSFTSEALNILKEVIIPAYLSARVDIFGASALLSKHHFICHYPELIQKFGPVFYLWTLRFESFHSFFKQIGRYNHNFIHLERSLALKHQLRMCYLYTGVLFEPGITESKQRIPLVDVQIDKKLEDFVKTANMPSDACVMTSATFNGLNYSINDTILLRETSLGELLVGDIKLIVSNGAGLSLVVKTLRAVRNIDNGLYSMYEDHLLKEYSFIHLSEHQHPVAQPVYIYGGQRVISLKHKLFVEHK